MAKETYKSTAEMFDDISAMISAAVEGGSSGGSQPTPTPMPTPTPKPTPIPSGSGVDIEARNDVRKSKILNILF